MKPNIGFAISALVLSILLWLHVQNELELKVSRAVDIPLRYVNLNDQFILKTIPDKIQVMAEGTVEAHDQLRRLLTDKNSTILAIVDLKDARPDASLYKVRMPRNEALSKINISLSEPPEVAIIVQEVVSKSMPVEAVATNVPEGFIYSQAQIRPANVVVKGSAVDLAKIASVRALLDLDGYQAGRKMVGRVEVLDDKGKPLIPSVVVAPETVEVYPSLAAAPPERSLIVAVRISEGSIPSAGFRLVGYSVQPQTVMVRGDQKLLERMQSIPTEAIRLDGLKEKTTKKVRLLPPTGIQLMSGDRISVTLEIEPIPIIENPASQTPPVNPAANGATSGNP